MLRRCVCLTILAVGVAAAGPAWIAMAQEETPEAEKTAAEKTEAEKTQKVEKKIDPSGTWKWERTRQDRTVKSRLRLVLKDGKVAGTYQGRGDEVEIEEAKLDGETLSFQYTRNWEDRTFTVKYRGKISEDTITGELEWSVGEQSGTRPWQAKRVVEIADILGTWKFKVTTDEGETIEPSITFTLDGDKLKGAYSSQWGDREAEKVELTDNVLSFEISGQTEETDFLVVYQGKPRGDSIRGMIKYDFGGNTGTIAFEGRRQVDKKKADAKSEAESAEEKNE